MWTRVLAVAIVAILCFGCPGKERLPEGSDELVFDASAWAAPSGIERKGDSVTQRQKMLKDLISNVLPGRSRSEIEALLGPALEGPESSEGEPDLIYRTGPERTGLFGINSEWLLIWLDDSGEYLRCEVEGD